MTTAKIIALVGFAMLLVPAAGVFLFITLGDMISSYKHAKFFDEREGTNHRRKDAIITMLMVLWVVLAGLCIIAACVLIALFPTRT